MAEKKGMMGGGKPSAAERNPMGQGVGATPNATPEEQAAYDQFVQNGLAMLYDEKAMQSILQRVDVSENPVEGIASATAAVVMRLEDSARQQGTEIPGEVKFQGGIEILEHLVELAEAAGIHEFSEQDMEQATLMAADTYREARQADGTLPVEELEDDMAALVQADQAGALDELVPGVGEYAAMAQQGQQKSRRGMMG